MCHIQLKRDRKNNRQFLGALVEKKKIKEGERDWDHITEISECKVG